MNSPNYGEAYKNTDFPNIGLEEAVENGIAETTCTTCNQERLTTEDGI